jgi:hypothetical protein
MGFLDDFGRAVGHAVSNIGDAIGGVIKTVAGDLENAVKIAENVFSGYIQGVGQVKHAPQDSGDKPLAAARSFTLPP